MLSEVIKAHFLHSSISDFFPDSDWPLPYIPVRNPGGVSYHGELLAIWKARSVPLCKVCLLSEKGHWRHDNQSRPGRSTSLTSRSPQHTAQSSAFHFPLPEILLSWPSRLLSISLYLWHWPPFHTRTCSGSPSSRTSNQVSPLVIDLFVISKRLPVWERIPHLRGQKEGGGLSSRIWKQGQN